VKNTKEISTAGWKKESNKGTRKFQLKEEKRRFKLPALNK
jgi:hypothetical protein